MRAFILLGVFALTACDRTTATSGTGTPPIRIAGPWTYTIGVMDASMTATCQANGTVTLNQTQAGDQFSGTGQGVQTCTNSGELLVSEPLALVVTGGELSGQSVRFTALKCVHTGAAFGSPPNQLVGDVTCFLSVPEGGAGRTFTGSWHAIR